MKRIPLIDRLDYQEHTGCWNWKGHLNNKGYGTISWKGKQVLASRLVAMFWLGLKENDPRDVLHRCDNGKCFNPKHLFLGTHQENMQDSARKGRHHCSKKTHCPRGHILDGKYPCNGTRYCRTCSRERCRKYAENKKRVRWSSQERANTTPAVSSSESGQI